MLLAFLTVRPRCQCGTGAFVGEFWELSAIIEDSMEGSCIGAVRVPDGVT